MINFSIEIENLLQTLCNTNNKEQNFQGILFQEFRNRFASQGFIVEMETNLLDEHLRPLVLNRLGLSHAASHNQIKEGFTKSEMDLLVYNEDFSEIYAAELKWIYHRDTGWNVLDHLVDFQDDAKFCKELKEKLHFTETCSLVVYDFDESKLVKNPRIVDSKDNSAKEKCAFIGGQYRLQPLGGIIMDISFVWKDLPIQPYTNQNSRYYIVKF